MTLILTDELPFQQPKSTLTLTFDQLWYIKSIALKFLFNLYLNFTILRVITGQIEVHDQLNLYEFLSEIERWLTQYGSQQIQLHYFGTINGTRYIILVSTNLQNGKKMVVARDFLNEGKAKDFSVFCDLLNFTLLQQIASIRTEYNSKSELCVCVPRVLNRKKEFNKALIDKNKYYQ
ncbi:hypothetical protein BpHYR1_036808 [Brachionus plicatilis]|uniref:Uncharacterized protein n=1 Tax=Brachionus plicatilis TaxID=10195 RepID=A0A3M7SIB8_BRAPC|nr:hypothetical protein BpHYR1_036808 [Brachionus plicatilis]